MGIVTYCRGNLLRKKGLQSKPQFYSIKQEGRVESRPPRQPVGLPYLIPTGKPKLSGRNNWKRAASQGILALSMSLGIAAFRTKSTLSKRLCYYGYIESNGIDGCSSSKIVHPPPIHNTLERPRHTGYQTTGS